MGDTPVLSPQKAAFWDWWFREAVGGPPDPYQLDVATRKGPLVIVKARQTGVSTVVAALAVAAAGVGGRKELICSNKEDSARHILEYAGRFVDPLRDAGVLDKPDVDSAGLVRWPNGGEIRCFAANPSGARGFPANDVYFDEFAHFTKEIDMDRRMLEAVAPSISGVGGRLVLLSTPNGTKNEFYRQWEATPEANRISIHWRDCPRLRVREEVMPHGKQYWIEGSPAPFPEASFRQEFCGDFYVGSDEAIPLEALRAALRDDAPPPPLGPMAIGADIGREVDATAYVTAGWDAGGNAWVAETARMERAPFPDQSARLDELIARHRPAIVVMDRTYNPQSTEDAQRRHPGLVEPFVFGAQSKIDLVMASAALFTAGRVRVPARHRRVIDELANVRRDATPAGAVRYEDHPHGDLGWAAFMALWGLLRFPPGSELGGVVDGGGKGPGTPFGRGRW